MRACQVLGLIGPEARLAVPTLIELLCFSALDADSHVNEYRLISIALTKIGDQRAANAFNEHRGKPLVLARLPQTPEPFGYIK
jgi:hypothetical protein